MTLSINHQNNVPEHVAAELDRLGNSDEGIGMKRPPGTLEGNPEGWSDYITELARQLEQVEAERDSAVQNFENLAADFGVLKAEADRYREALERYANESPHWLKVIAKAALHPKERDDG